MTNNTQFNGLLLVDKPSGISSHDVVARLRRILRTKAVGHSGTLDPMASGLMVCLINEGTKLSQYILEGDKGYRVRAQFGLRTDTLDTTGEVLEKFAVDVSLERIRDEALKLQGEMELDVPIYSAIKVQGKKLYEYARENKDVSIPKKVMKFWDVTPVEIGPDWAEFDIKCSKGSYIRTWVDLLGKALGCGAAMSSLRRTWSSPYFLTQAQTLEDIENTVRGEGLVGSGPNLEARFDSGSGVGFDFGTTVGAAFIALEKSLPQFKKIRVKGQDRVLLGNGQISHDLRSQLITLFNPSEDQYIQIIAQDGGQLLALVGLEPGKGFALRRVFK
ncbi:MAG: tRNA pseudouridine(55) synthase TruB [Pseudobdellovibrionaceae bacterium]